ncbi:hypothetical protein Tsp_15293, partial [Trichinella spiralis]|uniref:hypothetical protein n=1 Tax=Trichinella spiralis TaxID=6334 RepID=UPI0001EFE49D
HCGSLRLVSDSWESELKVSRTTTMFKSGRVNGKIVRIHQLFLINDILNYYGERTKVNVKFKCEAIEVENCYAQLVCCVVNPKEVQCVYHTVFPPDMTAKMDIDSYLHAVNMYFLILSEPVCVNLKNKLQLQLENEYSTNYWRKNM